MSAQGAEPQLSLPYAPVPVGIPTVSLLSRLLGSAGSEVTRSTTRSCCSKPHSLLLRSARECRWSARTSFPSLTASPALGLPQPMQLPLGPWLPGYCSTSPFAQRTHTKPLPSPALSRHWGRPGEQKRPIPPPGAHFLVGRQTTTPMHKANHRRCWSLGEPGRQGGYNCFLTACILSQSEQHPPSPAVYLFRKYLMGVHFVPGAGCR